MNVLGASAAAGEPEPLLARDGSGPDGAAGSSLPPLAVYLVDDHDMFRTQLAKLIGKQPGVVICGESDNAQEAMRAIPQLRPDVVIVDISLRGMNGLDVIRELRSTVPGTQFLVLSMHDESMYAERALRAGASGYVMKQHAAEHLRDAMEHVLGGGVFFSAQLTTQLLQKLAATGAPEGVKDIEVLSPREKEIFRLIGRGLTTRDIALELQLGEKTIHSHRHQIKVKLGIRHVAELYSLSARWVEEQSRSGNVDIALEPKMQQDGLVHD